MRLLLCRPTPPLYIEPTTGSTALRTNQRKPTKETAPCMIGWLKPGVGVKTLLEGNANIHAEPGWRSGYRASLEIISKGGQNKNGGIAGGLRARRGSNPFPGANQLATRRALVNH